ncbi:hypothetical protein MTO96_036009 [Rhipicephalus appendiculatus]
MLFSAVLASALRNEENENGCHESTTRPTEVQSNELGCNGREHREQGRFRYNRYGSMESRRPTFGNSGGDDTEEDRAFERLASLAKYARSKLPFANQRSRATGQTSRSCNKL